MVATVWLNDASWQCCTVSPLSATLCCDSLSSTHFYCKLGQFKKKILRSRLTIFGTWSNYIPSSLLHKCWDNRQNSESLAPRPYTTVKHEEHVWELSPGQHPPRMCADALWSGESRSAWWLRAQGWDKTREGILLLPVLDQWPWKRCWTPQEPNFTSHGLVMKINWNPRLWLAYSMNWLILSEWVLWW